MKFRISIGSPLVGLLLALLFTLTLPAQAQSSQPAVLQAISAQSTPPAAPLRVVASFSILADLVREVGGEDIRLDVLVGPLRDAHAFEPGPRDAQALGAAQVLVVNGLGFEAWLPRLLEASGFRGDTVLASQGVVPRRLGVAHDDQDQQDGRPIDASGAHPAGSVDPHAWQSLANGVQYVQNIAQGLAQADPAHASAYFARADALIRQLRKADAQWRGQLARIPADQRVLATTHDAFGYLGDAYGIRILSLVGVSTEAEPSARAMADLLQQIRSLHVRAIFLEQGSSSRALQQLADEAGVALGGTLFADTLDRPGQPADSYLGMFRWNAQQMLQAMMGKEPES
ncbi:metal ABC transporter solute-binding protein, Zn/Mn family [Castellaniella sp.]|uniref:metal ABC transporter solute-binding protein, Zn/Mn family n=1 Tax=Castellaniella sp. TaxID=1955812 RepID=UPI002B002332|nr:zinc ABC transporter substrate-binding protein [Castellaniella sp.]